VYPQKYGVLSGTLSQTMERGLGKILLWHEICFSVASTSVAFSALTLLVGRQEGHPACKKLSGGVLA